MTAATTQAKAPRRFGPLRLQAVALACLCVAVAVITVERTWLALVQPLWFDEAWTAAVAATPDWRSFISEAYNDVNAPLYYALMRLWEGLAGPSDFALRAPALLAILAAGAIPIASRIKGLSLEARLTWGAMIFGWWGVGVFLNGRCYAPLLAVSTLQCVLFARLLLVPSRRNAWLWCGVAACAILLQYYALIAAAAQGLVYLAARRRARAPPAVLAFAPARLDGLHAPRLQTFSDAEVAWHAWSDLPTRSGSPPRDQSLQPFVLPLVAAMILAGLLLPASPQATPRPSRGLAVARRGRGARGPRAELVSARWPSSPAATSAVAPGLLLGAVLAVRSSARPAAYLA